MQLVGIGVGALLESGVELQEQAAAQGEQQVGGRYGRFPLPGAELPGTADLPSEQQPGASYGQQQHAGEERNDRIGLHDVADHFVGIDQVIDGDEVVPYAEFAPEKPFGNGVQDNAARVKSRQNGEPGTSPSRTYLGKEQSESETHGPEAEEDRGDQGYHAAVFVEDRIEERDVNPCDRKDAEEDVAQRPGVFARGDAQGEKPQHGESDRKGAPVVHGAQQEDFQPLAESERDVGGLFVEQQDDAQQRADGYLQQNEFEVDSRDEFDAGLHGVCLLNRHKYIYFNRF